ncbi:Lissencephaly-1 [Gossypium arboreum]|uniref:Lissencephaly-1 n=1 Tax=Gossypium arboreum TaxID=29729 RepID=A0A0B0MQY1_GOSAR|nr:Lissencephaly-1 [Gossypium arboreum]
MRYRSYCELGGSSRIVTILSDLILILLKMHVIWLGLTQLGWQVGYSNGPFFVHSGRDTGVCLSRVQHTAMLHGHVSPGVPYNCKSGSSMANAHRRVLLPCEQVSMYALF